MRKIAFILAICLLISSLGVTVLAADEAQLEEWRSWEVKEWNEEWVVGEDYTDGVLLIYSLELIDTSKYTEQDSFDFYGVPATDIYIMEEWEGLFDELGFVVYCLELDSSVSVREAYEMLKANEDFSETAHARPDLAYIIPSDPDNSNDKENDETESAPKSDALPERTVWNDEWVDGVNYAGDQVYIHTDFVIDLSQYDLNDFYGVKVKRIFHYGSYKKTEQEDLDKYGYVTYGVIFDPAEICAKDVFFALNNEYNLVPEPVFLDPYDEPDFSDPDPVPQDVNGDGEFNMFDYIYVKSVYFNIDGATDEEQANADLNGDGKVNMFDYVQIKNAYFAQ